MNQPHGIVHGGAIATLIDTVVVPAIARAYDSPRVLLTITMNVNYLAAVAGEDANFCLHWGFDMAAIRDAI